MGNCIRVLLSRLYRPLPEWQAVWLQSPGQILGQFVSSGAVETEIGDWKMSDFKLACADAASQGWLIVGRCADADHGRVGGGLTFGSPAQPPAHNLSLSK